MFIHIFICIFTLFIHLFVCIHTLYVCILKSKGMNSTKFRTMLAFGVGSREGDTPVSALVGRKVPVCSFYCNVLQLMCILHIFFNISNVITKIYLKNMYR